MRKSLSLKIVNILFIVLFAISTIFGVLFFANVAGEDTLLVWTYILTAISIVLLIAFGLANMFRSKRSIISSLIMLVLAAVLIGISYSLASDAIPLDAANKPFDITAVTSKWSGAVLYLLYILLGLSFISLLYTEIRGAFK